MSVLTIRTWDIGENRKKVYVEEDYEELAEELCNPVDNLGRYGDAGFWVWVCDGKEHKSHVTNRKYPMIILPRLIHMYGNEADAKAIGYRKMHCVARREYTLKQWRARLAELFPTEYPAEWRGVQA